MKPYYRLKGKHGTYSKSKFVYDIEEARKWRDEIREKERDKTIEIVRVREIEEVVK